MMDEVQAVIINYLKDKVGEFSITNRQQSYDDGDSVRRLNEQQSIELDQDDTKIFKKA